MKSSMTTTSRLGVFKMRLPEVIRTKKTLAVSNPTPKNERLPRLVGPGNTFPLNSRLPLTSKYSIFVLLPTFTSVNTAPNPLLVADCVVPGIKKSVSVMLLSKPLKSIWNPVPVDLTAASGKCAAYSVVVSQKIPEGGYRVQDIVWSDTGRFEHLRSS